MTEEEFQEELSARDADIAELNDQSTELTLQKRAFSKELQTLKRQMGLLRSYHDSTAKMRGWRTYWVRTCSRTAKTRRSIAPEKTSPSWRTPTSYR